MIKLDVYAYCSDCPCFEPVVACRPEAYFCNGTECEYVGDTIVRCENRGKCQCIYTSIMECKNKEDA